MSMRIFAALFLVMMICACSDAGLSRPPPFAPGSGGAGSLPVIADAGLIVPTIDTRPFVPDPIKDGSASLRDAVVDLGGPELNSDGSGSACDLLKQDCPNRAYACYPVSGKGRCLFAGGVGENGACFLGADPPQCAPGLTCVNSILQGGVCLTLCDVFNPTAHCLIGTACQPLPLFTNVGYCVPG